MSFSISAPITPDDDTVTYSAPYIFTCDTPWELANLLMLLGIKHFKPEVLQRIRSFNATA